MSTDTLGDTALLQAHLKPPPRPVGPSRTGALRDENLAEPHLRPTL